MCGRTACTLAPDDVVTACTYKDGSGKRRRPVWKESPGGQKYCASYNLAPASHMPVLVSSNFDGSKTESSSERTVIPMKWGLTPSWHRGDPYKVPYETNNCRAEGMLEKKTYKVPLQKGFRCVVLADGYFEWKTTQEGKQPYFFYFPQPKGISYPGETVKTELQNDMKDEKSIHQITHLDKALKQEVLTQEINQKESHDIKVKDEIVTDTEHTSATPIENGSDIKPEKSFWDSLSTDTAEVKSQISDETSKLSQSCDKMGSCSIGTKIKDVVCESDEVPEWKGQRLLTMAAVYDVWNPSDGSPPMYSYSVITVPASSDINWCHHRMPAILSTDDEIQDWLDSGNVPLQKATSVIKPYMGLAYHPVSKLVNNSRHKSPDCIKPVELGKPKASPSSNIMMNWLTSGSPAKKKKAE